MGWLFVSPYLYEAISPISNQIFYRIYAEVYTYFTIQCKSFDIARNILCTIVFIVNCSGRLSAEFVYKRICKHFDLINSDNTLLLQSVRLSQHWQTCRCPVDIMSQTTHQGQCTKRICLICLAAAIKAHRRTIRVNFPYCRIIIIRCDTRCYY